MTFSPSFCIEFDGFGTLIAVAFLFYTAGFWHKKIRQDRFETIDQTKRDVAAWQANYGLALGEPVVINRADASETIFRRNPWREDPSFTPLQWAA